MEVLQSITSYVENMKDSNYTYESQKEALGLLYEYCSNMEPKMHINEVDSSFFDEFLIYWLPKNQSRLGEKQVYQVLKGVRDYCTYIQDTYDIPNLEKYEVMKKHKRECLRIYQLKYLFSKHLGDPILNIKPLIVDFKAYKKYKVRKSIKEKQGIYEQGLFEVIDIDFDNTIVLRKLPKGRCVRIILEDSLVIYMRKGDILHLRIKRKQFFSCWEVEDLKNCYLSNAGQYLMN